MQFENDRGTPVDPVPFLVVASSAFLLLYSFVPGYLLAVGVTLVGALGVTTALFVAAAAVAYHRMVHRARPALREHVPVGVRFRRLYYAVLAGIAAFLLLMVVSLRL